MRAQVTSSFLVLALVGAVVTACDDDSGNDVVAGKVEADADGDGWPESLDCDDEDPSVFPAADDVSRDGIDQDCSGHDGLGLGGAGGGDSGSAGAGNGPDKWVDEDGDGWPAFADCDDDDDSVFPNADEVAYDGIDQDCSGSDLADMDGDGVLAGDDCDDADASVYAGRLEIALDGVDQDCDGSDLIGTDAFVSSLPEEAAPGGVPTLVTGKDSDGNAVVLAAWPDSRNAPSQDLYARFLGEDGEPAGEAFPINTGGLAKENVRIAANADHYLVTWRQADGVWAQQLDLSGALDGSLLAIASNDVEGPRVAWGGSNWALAWTNASGAVQCRGVSEEGVRSDIHVVAGPDLQGVPALAGSKQGFLVAWADDSGIAARLLDATGTPVVDQVTIASEPNVASPEAIWSDGQYLVAFSRGAGTFSVRGQFVSDALVVSDAGQSIRLSSDTLGVSGILLAPTPSGVFPAWNDARHQFGVPAYGAIYGNAVASDGSVAWDGGAGLHVDMTADLGGVAVIGETVLVATRVGNVTGVIARKVP